MNTRQPMKKVRVLPGASGWDSFANVERKEGEVFEVPAHMRVEDSSWLEDAEPEKKPSAKSKTDSDDIV